jgi:HK97 family phage major capsid protein
MEHTNLDNLAKVLDAKIEKSVLSAKDNVKGEVEASLKTEIKNLEQTISEGQKKLNDRMDVFEVNNKKNSSGVQAETKSFKSALSEALKDGAIDSLKKGNTHKSSFEIKADMTTADNFTGEVIAPTRVPGFKFDPATTTHVRTLLSTGTTNSDTIRYVKESAYTNNAGATAEGSQLGQSEFDLTAETKNVELIGTYMRISRQMLEDTEQLIYQQEYLLNC